jgi:methionyl-tRNA synthetase
MDKMARILITSALPYINGIKHLGNLIGSMLPADVYARFERARGHEVLYICATDEHGTPAELAALEAGQSVEDFCAEQHALQADIYRRFHLSFDHFGRSSSPQNHALTQHFARRLAAHHLLEERSTEQVFSLDDNRFLPDRYIIGTCPYCGYERARGDQCENCTRVLDPTDLRRPRSAVSGSERLEVRQTRHLFLKQSLLEPEITAWINTQDARHWPLLVTSIARKWLKEGLRDRCITRDLHWGVPVNQPGFSGKVFYVWFDAPIAYIAATQEWAAKAPGLRNWQSWWQPANADDIRYIQFMAKDNIPFHTVSFPATLLGSRENWKMVDYIKGFSWLTWYGGKFSTSQRRGIFTDQALAEYPADYWRYALMASIPEGDDASFTLEGFAGLVNKDLGDVLGNFVNRTLKFCASRFGGLVPQSGPYGRAEAALIATLEPRLLALTTHLEKLDLRKAMVELRALWVIGNEYLAQEAPWTRIKTDPDGAALTLRMALNLIGFYAAISAPIIPDMAARLAVAVGLYPNSGQDHAALLSHITHNPLAWPHASTLAASLDRLAMGQMVTVPPLLVQKIDSEAIAHLAVRYGASPID